MLHPILRQGIRLFIGTTSKTRNYILLSTRGRGQITFQGTWGNVEILPSSRLFFKKMLPRLNKYTKGLPNFAEGYQLASLPICKRIHHYILTNFNIPKN